MELPTSNKTALSRTAVSDIQGDGGIFGSSVAIINGDWVHRQGPSRQARPRKELQGLEHHLRQGREYARP